MAGKPIGTIYAELDLDTTKYTKAQQSILKDAQVVTFDIEKNFKNLGLKSSAFMDVTRAQIINSYQGILHSATSTSNDILRAEEAKNAKIKALNEQQFGVQTSLLDSLKSNWIAVSAVALATYYTIQKFFKLAELGATIKSIEDSFVLMSRNAGIAGDALISNLKKITNETIDDSDLIKKANRLIVEGFSADQIVQVGAAARVAARLMGTDVSAAYEQIADSIVNLRQRGLKTAGFVIDLEEAYKKHAAALGIDSDRLSQYGKQMALMEAVYQKTIELQEKIGITHETASERIQKQKTIWKELHEEIAKAASSLWDFITASAYIAKGALKGENIPDIISRSTIGNREAFLKARETLGWLTESEKHELEMMQGAYRERSRMEMYGMEGKGSITPPPSEIAPLPLMKEVELKSKELNIIKEMLGIGGLSLEDQEASLEIERQITIEALKQYGNTKKLVKWTNELFEAKKDQLEIDHENKIVGEERKNAEEDYRDKQHKEWAAEKIFWESNAEYNYKMSDFYQYEENVLKGRVRLEEDLKVSRDRTGLTSIQILETQIAKEKELRSAKVSLGWMRPGEAGLAGLEEEKNLLAERLILEEQRLQRLRESVAPLSDIYTQEDKITILKREQAVLDASRLRYISETASAYEGLESGFQKYVTESGTLYSRLENMTNSLAKGMEGAFSSFFESIFDKSKSWSEKMQGLFQGLANSFIKALSDMAAKEVTTGFFGLLSLFGSSGVTAASGVESGMFSLATAQQGASFWTHGPTPIMAGEGGESEFVSITPKSKMANKETNGGTQIYFINPIGFDEALMKNMGTILKGVAKDSRAAGSMRTIIRGA